MKKEKRFWVAACVLLVLVSVFQLKPHPVWGQTNEICYDCHVGKVISTPHHNLGLPSCFACHTVGSGPFGSLIFLPPDCQQCHVFSGGPGGTIHDFHTSLIPSQIPDCEACHVGGAPGGPLREPFGECANCHTGFQGGPAGGLLHQRHTGSFGAADCTICHGTNATACVFCHDQVSTTGKPNLPANFLGHDFRLGVGLPSHDFHTGLFSDPLANCTVCHTSGAPDVTSIHVVTPSLCSDCHQNNLLPQHGSNCALCHQSTDPLVTAAIAADNTDCTACHVLAGGPGMAVHDFHTERIPDPIASCLSCHKDGVPGIGALREPFGRCAADTCHSGFQGGPGNALHNLHASQPLGANCANCHAENAPACNLCHEVDRHDFRSGFGEGHDFHVDPQNPPGITSCETCHVSGAPDVTSIHQLGNMECTGCHYTNLLTQHDRRCGLCHGSTDPAVRQAIANDNIDCRACHGQMPHALDCMLCHTDENFANYLGRGREVHSKHKDRVACGICHSIPETVFWGPRDNACATLCHSGERIRSAQDIHEEHMDRFDKLPNPCSWCHGLSVPPRPANICNLCHSGRSGGAGIAHDKHAEKIDCSACHPSVAGFNFDVRTTSRNLVCVRCHSPEGGDARKIHDKHVLGKAQCYACHGNANVYASLPRRGDLDCSICHGPESDRFQDVHKKHAGEGMMCTVCHSAVPPTVNGVQGFEQ